VAANDVVVNESRPRASRRRSTPAFLIVLSGLGIGIGACLPWMYYFAGLVPLRGVIGLNGRLLLSAGAVCVALGVMLGRGIRLGPPTLLRRVTAALGVVITCVAGWLLIGVWELAHTRGESTMLVLRPGPGLFVVGLGGVLLVLTACIPERHWSSGVPAKHEKEPVVESQDLCDLDAPPITP
jgi:hypothetical protein